MFSLAREFRWSARRLAQSPGPTLAALIVLTLGLGSTVTLYTVARAVVLADLPLENSGELVVVERRIEGEATLMHSPADLLDLRERRDLFSALSAKANFRSLMTGTLEPTYVNGASVTPEYFETIGATPLIGQTFRGWDDRTDVVVLSWRLWQTRLGGDPAVVGKIILLDDHTYRVVGVMPKALAFLEADLWVPGPQGLPKPPFPMGPDLRVRRDLAYLTIVGRLHSGWKPATARAAVEAAGRAIVEKYPANLVDTHFSIRPMKELVVGDAHNQLLVLSAGVGLVFLLVCLSVAGLLLGHNISRSYQDAIRVALGASRAQVLVSRLADGLLLATAGGVLGTVASIQGVHLFMSLAPLMRRSEQVSLDVGVLLFAAGASLVASLLAGVLPGLRMMRSHPGPILASRGPHGQGRDRELAWTTLLVVQVSLMVLLLLGSLMLSRRLLQLRAVDLGFNPEGLLVASLVLPNQHYSQPARIVDFFDELLARLAARPDVEAAAAGLDVPLHQGKVGLHFSIVGGAGESGTTPPAAWFSAVSTGYFDAIGIRVLAGRGFTTDDRVGSPPVAVVSEAMAMRYWLEGKAVGAQLRFGRDELVRVVGVVSDVRHGLIEVDAEPRVYRPYAQAPWLAMSVVLRSRGDPARLIPVVRSAVSDIDPAQPPPTISLMEDSLADSLRPTRYLFLIVGGFSAMAVIITAVGLYGLLSFRVREDEYNIAIRLALGAPRPLLVRTHLTRGLLIGVAGVVLGAAAAVAAWPVVERMMPTMHGSNGKLLPLVALISVLVAVLSSVIPACHVLKVDPSQVSRGL